MHAFAPNAKINNGARASVLRMAEGSNISGPPFSGPASKPILDAVKYPSDMKRLNMRELKQVRVVFRFGFIRNGLKSNKIDSPAC